LQLSKRYRTVADDRSLFADRIRIIEAFLTLENIGFVKFHFPQTGVLSIDVDGNDYWFLEKLIDANPTVICVEYNASMGLESIAVPYDPSFDRYQKHPSGWYQSIKQSTEGGVFSNHLPHGGMIPSNPKESK